MLKIRINIGDAQFVIHDQHDKTTLAEAQNTAIRMANSKPSSDGQYHSAHVEIERVYAIDPEQTLRRLFA